MTGPFVGAINNTPMEQRAADRESQGEYADRRCASEQDIVGYLTAIQGKVQPAPEICRCRISSTISGMAFSRSHAG